MPACDMARIRECEKSEARNNGSNRYTAHGTIISDWKRHSQQSKTANDSRSSKTSVLGCSEVIFRDAEKCRTSRHCTRKTSLHSQVEAIRSRWSQIVKSQIENQIKSKNYGKE